MSKPKKQVKITRTVTEQGWAEVNSVAIADLLHEYLDIPEEAEVTVFFDVPTGGDMSGERIEIDDDNPVHVCWKTVAEDIQEG